MKKGKAMNCLCSVAAAVMCGAAYAGPQPGLCCHNKVCDPVADINDCAVLGGTVVPDCDLCVPSGADCWDTTCGETRYDFCETPLPADFFNPGSDPFEGTVYWQSDPGITPSTIMVRGEEAVLDVGDCQTVPIQLEQLSLVSCQPIEVTGGGGSTFWDVQVQDLGAPPGQMEVCKTHPQGGTFTSEFFVQPVFIFREVGNPTNERIFDTAQAGIVPTLFQSARPANWSTILAAPCDPLLDLCCTLGFQPGYDSTPGAGCTTDIQCCTPVGHDGPGHIHETGPPVCVPCECGACCLPGSGCSEVVADQGNMLTAEEVCTNQGGTYMGAGTSCDDLDGDGLPDVLESNGCCGPKDACHLGTSPHALDSDGDGIGDGNELAVGSDPCDAASVSDIPAVSSWGVLVMAVAILTAGTLVYRGRYQRTC